MKFWDLDKIREALQDMNLRAIAPKVGVHENTLYNLMNKKEKSLDYKTYLKLVSYLTRNQEKVAQDADNKEA